MDGLQHQDHTKVRLQWAHAHLRTLGSERLEMLPGLINIDFSRDNKKGWGRTDKSYSFCLVSNLTKQWLVLVTSWLSLLMYRVNTCH